MQPSLGSPPALQNRDVRFRLVDKLWGGKTQTQHRPGAWSALASHLGQLRCAALSWVLRVTSFAVPNDVPFGPILQKSIKFGEARTLVPHPTLMNGRAELQIQVCRTPSLDFFH